MPYDLTLGGIDLPTLEVEFSETIGADYTLVGAVPMPGPPRPASLYDMTIPIHGEPEDGAGQWAAGIAKRLSVRSLIQNDATRYAGIELEFPIDPDIEGWLVIGTAQLSYAPGNITLAEFSLRISGAALIPAQQTLSAHRLLTTDRRLTTTPQDTTRKNYRAEPLDAPAIARHYLPVGAFDVVGQADPRGMETKSYDTIFGKGVYVEDRVHGELVRFDREWKNVTDGSVRVWDTGEKPWPEWTPEGDRKPDSQLNYGWTQFFDGAYSLKSKFPVLDNGVCRVRLLDSTDFAIDQVDGDHYKNEVSKVFLGYENVRRVMLTEWSRERAVVRATLENRGKLADVAVILQRGWSGPRIEVQHHSDFHPNIEVTGQYHRDSGKGWEAVQLGASTDEALMGTVGVSHIVGRF